jgi:hypothetical protein
MCSRCSHEATVTDYLVGLDLGQTTDFTALAVIERSASPETTYSLRHLQRVHLGTSYTAIIELVAKLLGTAPLAGCSTLVVDETGLGRPVVDMLRPSTISAPIIPITITAGKTVSTTDHGGFHVPKKQLVTCLQLLLQNQRLRIPSSLPDAKLLTRELLNFQVKITPAANEVFGACHQSHDDMVLSVALACWLAEHDLRVCRHKEAS